MGPGAYNPTMLKTAKTFSIKDNMYDRFGNLKALYAIAKNPNFSETPYEPKSHDFLKYSKT